MKNLLFISPLFLLFTACTTVDSTVRNQPIKYSELESKMYANKTLESTNMSEYDKVRYMSENNSNAIHWDNLKEFKRQLEAEKK